LNFIQADITNKMAHQDWIRFVNNKGVCKCSGKIWLESKLVKVQYFYFTLPLQFYTRRKIIVENVLQYDNEKIVMGENLKNIICRR
jgi:hypothetical protein